VLLASATAREGIDELRSAIATHREHLKASGELETMRRARLLREVESLVAERFRLKAAAALGADDALAADIGSRRVDPYRAAAMLVGRAAVR
jgi:LAO/AO transport system kinase